MGSDCQRIWLAMLLFFFSGMAGLLYEVLWMRELSLLFGATGTLSLSAFPGVLSLFGARLCITVSVAFWVQGRLLVLCGDVDWSDQEAA